MRMIILMLLLLVALPGIAISGSGRMLFDQGHGQAFTIDKEGPLQLGDLAERFRQAGWQVTTADGPLTSELLTDVDALVISGAFKPLSAGEIGTLDGFLKRGGHLVVMLHIPQPLTPLLSTLGVAYANGVLFEGDPAGVIGDNAGDFQVSRLAAHPLTQGLDSFAVYGCWPLKPMRNDNATLATTSERAWIDFDRNRQWSETEPRQEFSVLVTGSYGQGAFAVFGDDALFQNRFLTGENQKLVDNLSRWLAAGGVADKLEI